MKKLVLTAFIAGISFLALESTAQTGTYTDDQGEYRYETRQERVWVPEERKGGIFGVGGRTIPGHYENRSTQVKVYRDRNGNPVNQNGQYGEQRRGWEGKHPHGMPPGQRKKIEQRRNNGDYDRRDGRDYDRNNDGVINSRDRVYDRNRDGVINDRDRVYDRNRDGVINERDRVYDRNRDGVINDRDRVYDRNRDGVINDRDRVYDRNRDDRNNNRTINNRDRYPNNSDDNYKNNKKSKSSKGKSKR
ncbi:hypothetical protein WG906_01625 [Pedobacter sp. P351]|uniref:hypothetical protein n=1 Tax=Pedobacter superstes TaxID=3133441 RepID=UPI003097CB82